MKKLNFIALFLLIGCQDDVKNHQFDFDKAAGVWVLTELVYEDGSVHTGSFESNSFFGVYAESFKLNADRTFVPLIWHGNNDFTLKTEEAGFCSYSGTLNKLTFSGIWELNFYVTKFENDELWLKDDSIAYKFRRQKT